MIDATVVYALLESKTPRLVLRIILATIVTLWSCTNVLIDRETILTGRVARYRSRAQAEVSVRTKECITPAASQFYTFRNTPAACLTLSQSRAHTYAPSVPIKHL